MGMSCNPKKYSEYFPTDLFWCSDSEHYMHIILSLKYLPDANQKELVGLLHHCGARTSFNLEDLTSHSAIIVDHNHVVSPKTPAFTLQYLKDCLEDLKIENITDYRQDSTKHIAKNVDFMDVIYHRRKSWNLVLTEADKKWLVENVVSSESEEVNHPISFTSVLLDEVDSRLGLNEVDEEKHEINGFILSSDDDSDLEQIIKLVREVRKPREEPTRSQEGPYVERQPLGRNEKSEENKTVQSKEPFTKSKDLPRLAKENKTVQSKEPFTKSKNEPRLAKENKTVQSKEPFTKSKDEPRLAKENKTVQSKEPFTKSKDEPRVADDVSLTSKASSNKSNFFDFDEDDNEVIKPHQLKKQKSSRMPYSDEEKRSILKYIIKHCEYSRIKGRELWMVMEKHQVCPNRTWQSMKEHFLKNIVLNLDIFDFLTENQRRRFIMVL